MKGDPFSGKTKRPEGRFLWSCDSAAHSVVSARRSRRFVGSNTEQRGLHYD